MAAYRDAKGISWYVKFRYKDWQNETKWVTKRGFATKREALQWEREFLQKKAGDVSISFPAFVETYKAERFPRLKQSTRIMKESLLDSIITPYFKNKKLNEITSSNVIQWQNTLIAYRNPMTGKRYSSSYLKTIHNQLSAVFNYAVRFYGLKSNPARIAGNMGSEKDIEMAFWTKEEYLRFSEETMECPIAYYAFEVLYWCGIREGELLALTKADFNLDKKELSVTKTFHHLKGQDVITSPKTPKSKRKVTMPDFLCDEMQDFFEMNYKLSEMDRLFPVTKGMLSRYMQKFAIRSGLMPIRVHDLRHSHVSLLINLGFSAVAIADRMGHESIDITYRYAHLFPSVQGQMAVMLDKEKGDDYV